MPSYSLVMKKEVKPQDSMQSPQNIHRPSQFDLRQFDSSATRSQFVQLRLLRQSRSSEQLPCFRSIEHFANRHSLGVSVWAVARLKSFECLRPLLGLSMQRAADFQFCTKSFMLAFCVVENVDAKFCGHVKAVVRADVHAHLARSTGFPNDTDSAVVVTWDEEPRLHVLKAFVRVLNCLRLP